jgi:serine/threonine protein kinase
MAAPLPMEQHPWAFEDGAPFFRVDADDRSTLLGGGAYGAVYGSTLHGQPVAAKTLHALRDPSLYGLTGPGADPQAVVSVLAEFTKEAEVLAAVDHPHVLKFWGVCYGTTDGARLPKWIITERQPHSLHDFVRLPGMREEMKPRHTICLAADMAEGIAHLHSIGIIHRDVKPKNVLVGPQGAKLADLGTSKMVGIAARTAQHTVGPGTAIYHPPEVLAGEYTESIDVFGLGLSVWEIATGRVPPRDGAADEFTVADVVRQEYSFHRFYTDCRCIPPESYPENPSGIEALDVLTLGVFVLETTWMERRERPSAAQALTLLVGSEDESHVNHAAANAQATWTPDLLEVPAPGNIY